MSDVVTAITAERGATYGDFLDHATLSQALKDVMRAHPKYATIHPMIREELEMIQHKIGRIINGDATYADSHDDIAGYARITSERLHRIK